MTTAVLSRLKIFAAVALLAVAALGLASCGDDDDEDVPETATASGTATIALTDPPGTAGPTEEPFSGGSREAVQGEGALTGPTGILVNVRISRHTDYDRITFEFREDGRPPYRVEYVQPPIIADPSGQEVQIAGSAFLNVRMEPAAGHDPLTGEETYGGVGELNQDLPALVEAERTGDFEGVLQWVLGLTAETDFRVVELEGPPRIAIDVQHPATGG
jgi:hypothetical protein